MSKKHKRYSLIIGAIATVLTLRLELDYSGIASEGLTLSSIVLAIYVAAMMGLIGSRLADRLAATVTPDGEHTQLWVLREYFKNALIFASITIVVSSIVLLYPDMDYEQMTEIQQSCYKLLSIVGIVSYALNLFYMGITLVFMLNRQIWNE